MAASGNVSLQVPEHQHCIFCGLNANVTIYCSAPHNTMPPMTGGQKPHAYLPTGGSTTPAEAAQPTPQPDWVEAVELDEVAVKTLGDAVHHKDHHKDLEAVEQAINEILARRVPKLPEWAHDVWCDFRENPANWISFANALAKHAPKLPSAAEIATYLKKKLRSSLADYSTWEIEQIIQRVLDGGK